MSVNALNRNGKQSCAELLACGTATNWEHSLLLLMTYLKATQSQCLARNRQLLVHGLGLSMAQVESPDHHAEL